MRGLQPAHTFLPYAAREGVSLQGSTVTRADRVRNGVVCESDAARCPGAANNTAVPGESPGRVLRTAGAEKGASATAGCRNGKGRRRVCSLPAHPQMVAFAIEAPS